MLEAKTQLSITTYQMWHMKIPPLETFATHAKQKINSML
jgi:hypothetical protein